MGNHIREEYKVIKTPQVYKISVDKAEKKRDLERHRRDSMILLKYDMKLWTELNCLLIRTGGRIL